jgi:hypothetical protein
MSPRTIEETCDAPTEYGYPSFEEK